MASGGCVERGDLQIAAEQGTFWFRRIDNDMHPKYALIGCPERRIFFPAKNQGVVQVNYWDAQWILDSDEYKNGQIIYVGGSLPVSNNLYNPITTPPPVITDLGWVCSCVNEQLTPPFVPVGSLFS